MGFLLFLAVVIILFLLVAMAGSGTTLATAQAKIATLRASGDAQTQQFRTHAQKLQAAEKAATGELRTLPRPRGAAHQQAGRAGYRDITACDAAERFPVTVNDEAAMQSAERRTGTVGVTEPRERPGCGGVSHKVLLARGVGDTDPVGLSVVPGALS